MIAILFDSFVLLVDCFSIHHFTNSPSPRTGIPLLQAHLKRWGRMWVMMGCGSTRAMGFSPQTFPTGKSPTFHHQQWRHGHSTLNDVGFLRKIKKPMGPMSPRVRTLHAGKPQRKTPILNQKQGSDLPRMLKIVQKSTNQNHLTLSSNKKVKYGNPLRTEKCLQCQHLHTDIPLQHLTQSLILSRRHNAG